jgi:osmotically inducible lipoprotein OsmB
MKRTLPFLMILALSPMAACSHMSTQQQRALSGGAIGAAGGALLGGVTGGSPTAGAIIGGAAGAAVGAITSPDNHRHYRRY